MGTDVDAGFDFDDLECSYAASVARCREVARFSDLVIDGSEDAANKLVATLVSMGPLDAVELVLDAVTRNDRTINDFDLCWLAEMLAWRRLRRTKAEN
jgi:hypothetical protein